MAYLLLVVGILYAFAWAAGLVFAVKSPGKKNPLIPAVGLLTFIALSAVAAQASIAAMKNPPRLTVEAYSALQEGMESQQVVTILGGPIANPDRKQYDFTGRGISLPNAVGSRLAPGANTAEAVPAKLVLTIIGEPGRRKARESLGASSADEKNGLIDLQVVLTENGNETSFIEGEHWTYENGDTPEQVAQKIGDAINAHPSWEAEGSTEAAPKKVFVQSALETNRGDFGNEAKGRVASGPNTAVRVGYREDGKWVHFRGGQHSVSLHLWSEADIALDANFTMTDKLILVGYVDNKITEGGIRQAGLPLPSKLEEAPSGG
jgi:hypothetical protein